MNIIEKLREILDADTYARKDKKLVIQAFQRLKVNVSESVIELCANEILVLNTINDKVYRVDFEGGHEDLLNGKLDEEWSGFDAFLIEYFDL